MRLTPGRRDAAIAVTLVVVTLGIYAGVRGHDFIELDDVAYVTENSRVRAGLTFDNLIWLTNGVHNGNWHPLTTLSHMIDCELFALAPGPPHVVNVLLHAANVVLLFFVLARSTGTAWPSAFASALFAVHPLHVESVAWISERKDVLSGLFWMLALGAYVRYSRAATSARYAIVLVMLLLGLLAKPMVVTLPCVLLLWDVWPLRRLRIGDRWGALRARLLEKAPHFGLVVAASGVTLVVQSAAGAVVTLEKVPVGARIGRALEAYAAYLVDMIWPLGLAVVYPQSWPLRTGPVLGAALLLATVTAAVVLGARRRPYLLVGWLWYLVTLVPVIGLVQTGSQARADRYTYLPLIGIFVIIAWGGAEICSRRPALRTPLVAVALLIVTALSAATRVQVARWKDGPTLFRHALAVTRDNYQVHSLLGTTLGKQGDYAGALPHFERVVQGFPESADARCDLGVTLFRSGDVDGGIRLLEEALQLDPALARTHDHLGYAYGLRSDFERALLHYLELVRLEPRDPLAQRNLAIVQFQLGHIEEALRSTAIALVLAESRGQDDLAPDLRRQMREFRANAPPPDR